MYLHVMSKENARDPELRHLVDEVGDRCLALRTLSAARAVTRRYDAALRPTGLSITQFTLLVAIESLKPDAITSLAEVLCIERTALSRTLRPLEAKGLVERQEEAVGRAKPIRVTAPGRRALAAAYPLWREAQRDTEARLTQPHAEAARLLYTLRAEGPKY
ncbi:MAG: MarR family transcriptional regulator [Pseudomonadota bacterium]